MRTSRPTATIALAVATAAAFLLVAVTGRGEEAVRIGGFVPAQVGSLHALHASDLLWLLTPLTATLLHAGLVHLGFNLLVLVFCGREDEVALGAGGTLALYGVGAYAAAAAQWLAAPHSSLPMIGASGAISALVGAYAMLYGRRPSGVPPRFARAVHILWLLAAWVGLQLLVGVASLVAGAGIAVAAHVGGFLAGVFLARPLLRWRYRKA